ncbi:hypothetical protein WN48_07841 [Eufriesea mexicana]|uniref:Peptidyl-prolyl cis-trans isomerase CWC27 like protein n=1 Tax=Eufriesea mexicana TaxID=516756 RepID=A0A310SL34_9HYME|nr:hypothetical protein WN48_07841 [Eufriesea mexicana]
MEVGDPTGTGGGGKVYGDPFKNDRPLYAPKMIKAELLNNPFSDIIPRIIVQEKFSPDSIILCNEKFCYRDFNLLSYGEEAEEDEEESAILNKKSNAHNQLLNHLANKKCKKDRSSDWESDDEVKTPEELEVVKKEQEAMKKRIKNTMRDTKKEPKKVENYTIGNVEDDKDIEENE